MKRRGVLVLGSLCFIGASRSANAFPVIVVDEAHVGFSRPDGSEPPPYVIAQSSGVVVVTAPAFKFADLQSFGVASPNAIHLVKGNNQKYRSPWQGYGHRHELSLATLTPHLGSIPFPGFSRGDTAIIAIGFDHTGITPGKDNVLSAMWLGMIKVR